MITPSESRERNWRGVLTFVRLVPWTSILLWLVILLPTHAAVTEAWIARYNNVVSNANGGSSKFLRDAAGDLIVTGVANNGVTGADMLTCKYSSVDGAVLWQQRYDGPASDDDFAQNLALDSYGNAIVCGSSRRSDQLTDYYIAKYASATGALLWERRFQDPLNSASVTALRVDANDNVVVCGISITARLAAADGTLLWLKSYPGTTVAAVVDAEGNVVVTGATPVDAFSFSAHTVKYAAADGAIVWERHYPSATSGGGQATALAVDGAGDVFVSVKLDIGRWGNWYLAKYARSDGSIVWEQTGANQPTRMALDSHGNAIFSGYDLDGTGAWGLPATGHAFTVKFAGSNGTVQWAIPSALSPIIRFDANDNIIADSGGAYVKYAASNGAILALATFPFPGGMAKIFDGSGDVFVLDDSFTLSKYVSATGALLWHQLFQGPVNLRDSGQAVALDDFGNVVVTGSSNEGYSSSGSTGAHIYTAKYAAGSGSLLWETRYHGPSWLGSAPVAVAVDRLGNVIVTGSSYGSNGGRLNSDFYTAKYAAATGALLWERRHDGPLHGFDFPVGAAVDAGGNVVVAGYVDSETSRPVQYIAKYAATDGSLLWETSYYDRNSGLSYRPSAFCLDPSGDALVVGSGILMKYAGADGHVVWKRNSPGAKMVVDARGNVLVTGSASAKYAGVDGALIWEKSYGGSYLATDPEGNLLVTGFSLYAEGNFAKISGADGSVVWATHTSFALGLVAAADPRGDVFIVGDSTGKYDGATGALLWEKSNLGPDKGYNLNPAGVAFGPNRMIVVFGTTTAINVPNVSIASIDAWDSTAIVFREISDLSINLVAEGFQLRCLGEAGRIYQLWRSSNVSLRGSLIQEQSMPKEGVFEFTDPFSGADAAFYHLEVLPYQPVLSIRGAGANGEVISWPANATGFALQSTPSLTPPVTWLDVTNPPAVLGSLFTVTIPKSSPAQFFRLRKP